MDTTQSNYGLVAGMLVVGLVLGGGIGYYAGLAKNGQANTEQATATTTENPYAEIETNPYSDIKLNPFE